MYTIKITKTETAERLTRRTWEQGGPDGATANSAWGYTPQIPEKVDVTSVVLEMQMAELDVRPVVLAILDSGKP